LGLHNQSFLAAKQWQVQISYQYADTSDFYVGDQRVDHPQPNGPTTLFGTPPRRTVSILDLDVFYGLSNRVSLDLTIPYLIGGGGLVQGTPQSHRFVSWPASGFGDIALQGQLWLSDPTIPSPISGSVGLGIKAPTGSDTATGVFLTADGEVEKPIDEAGQLGNGGWELLLRAQGTAQIVGPLFAYGSGYYGLSLTEHTNVHQTNLGSGTQGPLRGVPDTYSGRLGAGYLLPFADGLFLSFGGRINGVTVKDVIGGGDLYWRRPGYEVYVEPGLSWTFGANIASVSVPLRVYQMKLDSLLDESLHRHIGSDFAPYLVVASFAQRF
jgi:hypothetical protein